MRVLSVKQPWADAIVHGPKRVENRTWMTRYRGGLAIHASLTFDREALTYPRSHPVQAYLKGAYGDVPDHRGFIIGIAELLDCHAQSGTCGCDGWGERHAGVTHLVLGAVQALAVPVPLRGSLGIRELQRETVREIDLVQKLDRPS